MILDYETYWNGEKASFGNLRQLVNLFEEVDEEYKAVIFPPSANIHPLNKELFEILRDFPDNDRFIPCAYINPNLHNSVEEL